MSNLLERRRAIKSVCAFCSESTITLKQNSVKRAILILTDILKEHHKKSLHNLQLQIKELEETSVQEHMSVISSDTTHISEYDIIRFMHTLPFSQTEWKRVTAKIKSTV